MRKIEVVPHDHNWVKLFQIAANELTDVLGQEVVAIHHIGSTAIPSIYAKSIIDILIEVHVIERIDDLNPEMIELGYRPRGEFGIPGRRFFIQGRDGERTRHVHMFQTGNPDVERHLNFRDYMIAHPREAQAYSRLKRELARKFPEDIEGYMDGKDPFIKNVERKALAWKETFVRDLGNIKSRS